MSCVRRMKSMTLLFLISLFLIPCSSSSSYTNNTIHSLSSIRCHPYESSALLDFLNSMTTNYSDPNLYTRSWKKGTDCCRWDGVICHNTSHHVVKLFARGLVGTLDSNNTLFCLRHLYSLDLSANDFCESPISPMFGSSFPYLELLDLSYANFSGEVPAEISQLSNLQYLDLSNDGFRIIIFAEISQLSSSLEIKMSTFSNIISNMTHLTDLDLNGINIEAIPSSLTNLSSLSYLGLRNCNLRGELPSNILAMPHLQMILLGGNHDLHAKFLLSNWSTSLKDIDLSNVNFSSKLPPFLSCRSLHNRLESLDLSGCNFHGQIPDWMWNIFANGSSIWMLDLSDNKFNGTINSKDFTPIVHDTILFDGYLNLSHNYLTGSLTLSIPWNTFTFIDLSYNMFGGSLPIPQPGNSWFIASNNKFTGPISSSFCNVTFLEFLDLSNNSLMNELPHCLGNFSDILQVLNLGSNIISGTLPSTFSKCSGLEYLDLSDNRLVGLGPRPLAECESLQMLNLRKNKFREEFPELLGNLSQLRVLDLSCNGFFGPLLLTKISSPFARLQVLDLSNNNFNGMIPHGYIESFKAMSNITHSIDDDSIYMESHDTLFHQKYFYSITLTRNGMILKYDKIITTLATLDLSNNKFEDEIPDSLGRLISIHGLNLSHNQFTGPIPPSLGNLKLLDFLDLSHNKLTGQIPQELTTLTSLGVFNVSENQLVGPIPHGQNFDTFSMDSYNGNLQLCGFPLPDCGEHGRPRHLPSKNDNKDDDVGMVSVWNVAMMGCGFGTFVSFVWGCYMLSIGRPLWLLKLVLILVGKVEKMIGRRRRRPRRGRN